MNEVEIISFNSSYQDDCIELFKYGLSTTYKEHVTPEISAAQEKFINSKLSINGDMYDIHKSYMCSDKSHFFIAINKNTKKLLGMVGVIPSTYDNNNKLIYDNDELNNNNVYELVRMSVHADSRGLGLGKLLCDVVENFVVKNNSKKIVLSTLSVMFLAIALYKKCNYHILYEESQSYDGLNVTITHMSKNI